VCVSALDARGALNMGGIYIFKGLFINEIGAAGNRHHFAGLEGTLLATDRVRGSDLFLFQRRMGIRVELGCQ
jgi:hypothetical protein